MSSVRDQSITCDDAGQELLRNFALFHYGIGVGVFAESEPKNLKLHPRPAGFLNGGSGAVTIVTCTALWP